MTSAARYLAAAIALSLVSAGGVIGGLLERRLAESEHDLATLNLNRATRQLQDLDGRLAWTRAVPWLLRGAREEVEARHAEVRYWQGDYASLGVDYPELARDELGENRRLLLTLAGARVRAGQASAGGNWVQRLDELDRVIGLYVQVLRRTDGHADAAYNYEFLVRRRDEIAAGGNPPDRPAGAPLGRGGGVEDMDMEDLNEVKIYVPGDMLDRESTDDPTLGSDAPLRRRG